MNKAIVGGMNEKETRAMLQKRGIAAFMTIAGSLPQKETEIANFDDLPTFSVMHQFDYFYDTNCGHTRTFHIWLKCDEPLCCDCADKIEIWIEPHKPSWLVRQVQIKCHWNDETCCVCGASCRDEIPF